jgi:predicted Zn-ribbon and HTH transcriptional regulator
MRTNYCQHKKSYHNNQMPIPQSMICNCRRCGHSWVKRIAARPVRCPHCKLRNWDVAAGKLKRGRPRKDESEPPASWR